MSDESAAKSGRTALRVAAVVLLVLVVAPFVVTGVPSIVGADESYVVLSGSMNAEPEPIIQPGDVVIVDGVNPATIEDQDIITFDTGNTEPVTHRVVNVTEENGQVAFRTKGDANEDADAQLIGPDQVIGEVIFVIPLIGHVVNFANTTQGFVLLVLLPIGLLVLSEVWNLVASAGGSSDDEEVDEFDPAPPVETTPAGAGVDATDSADDEGGSSTVTLQRTQMKWIAVGLVPIAVAASYAAFRLQSAWVITAAYASIGLFVLSVLLYLRMRWGAPATQESPEAAGQVGTGTQTHAPPSGPDGSEAIQTTSVAPARPVVENGYRRDPVVTGRIAGDIDTDSRVEVVVDSREELVEMAIEKESWVVHDPDVETYFLVDDGMLFRYEDGDGVPTRTDSDAATNGTGLGETASEWDEASGWVNFSATAETAASETAPTTRAPGELTPVVKRVESLDSAAVASNGDGPPPAWSDEEVTPAIRRVGATDEPEPEALGSADSSHEAEEAVETSRPSDEADRAATDGGTNSQPSLLVRTVGRMVGVPIRILGLLGYVVMAPPMTLYRLVRPSRGNENDSGTDGEVE